MPDDSTRTADFSSDSLLHRIPWFSSVKLRPALMCFVGCLALFVLAACTPDHALEQSARAYDSRTDEIDSLSRDLLQAQTPRKASAVVHVRDRPFLGLKTLPIPKGQPLPEELTLFNGITVPFEVPLSVDELARRITLASGLPVRLSGTAPVSDGAIPDPGLFTPLTEVNAVEGNDPVWSGPLNRLLDAWTNAYGYAWSYDGEGIVIERYRSSVFSVTALAGRDSFTTTQSSSTAQDSASLSGQSLSFAREIDVFAQLQEQIGALVGPNSSLAISPANATVAVRGIPADVERVGHYLQNANETSLRSVSLAVNIIDLERRNESDYALNFNVLLEKVFGAQGLRFETDGTSSVIGTIRPFPSGTNGNVVTSTLRALESVSRITRTLQGSVSALNNQPVTLQKRGSRNYIQNISVTTTDANATSSIEQDTIDTGFFLNFYPLIVGGDKVRVRLNIGVDELVALREFTSGSNTVQLPETTTDSIRLERVLQSGDTLVLSGLSSGRTSSDRSGQGHVDNIFLGGGRSGEVSDRQQIILLTVVVEPATPLDEFRERVL